MERSVLYVFCGRLNVGRVFEENRYRLEVLQAMCVVRDIVGGPAQGTFRVIAKRAG